jgi:hypothetical protein
MIVAARDESGASAIFTGRNGRAFEACRHVPDRDAAQLGWPELDILSQLRVIEELSAADGSVGWCVMIGCDSRYLSAFLEQGVAREMYSDLDTVTASSFGKPAGRAETQQRQLPG